MTDKRRINPAGAYVILAAESRPVVPRTLRRRWNWWWCGLGLTVNHRWQALGIGVKVCNRCGLQSGGWTGDSRARPEADRRLARALLDKPADFVFDADGNRIESSVSMTDPWKDRLVAVSEAIARTRRARVSSGLSLYTTEADRAYATAALLALDKPAEPR